jgi:hypothetical protein
MTAGCSVIVNTSDLAGGASDDAAPPDGGLGGEATSPPDGGAAIDTGSGVDAGVTIDDDAGSALETGSAADVSTGVDGEPPDDAGAAVDTGPGESGAPAEAGAPEVGPPETGAPETSAPPETGAPEAGVPETGPVLTTLDLRATKDAYVQDGASVNSNFGTDPTLMVKTHNTGSLDRNTWLSFDISGFSVIVGAKLRLFVLSLDTANSNPVPNLVSYAPTASDGWSETGITWNNAPASGNQVAMTTVTDPQIGGWVEIDVSTSVAVDSDGVATFMITSTPTTNRGAIYASRDNGTASEAPVLRVTGAQH